MSDWKTKFRPASIEEFVGNDVILETFVHDISKKNRKRAYLITGPRGVGKTTLARIGCKVFLEIDDINLTEINASDDRGIDTVRELKEQCSIGTSENRGWIIDEAHMTTVQFQNAILKLLEEGNPHDYFFICTTDPQKLAGTLKSRCGKYHLDFPEESEIKKLIRTIGKAEGFKVSPEVSAEIIKKSERHLRDAVDLLQSVYDMEEEKALKYLNSVVSTEAESPEAKKFVEAVYNQDGKRVKQLLAELKDANEKPEGLRLFLLSWGAGRLLKSWRIEDALIMENFEKEYYQSNPWPIFILDCYRAVASGKDDIPF